MLSRGVFYRNQCAGGTFSIYEDVRESQPFGRYETYAPVVLVPGTDVVVFLSHIRGLVLHRLKPLTDPADVTQCKSRMPSGGDVAITPTPRPEAPSTSTPTPRQDRQTRGAPSSPPPPSVSKIPQARDEAQDDTASNAAALSAPMIRSSRSEALAADILAPPTSQVDPAPNARALTSSDIRALRAQALN